VDHEVEEALFLGQRPAGIGSSFPHPSFEMKPSHDRLLPAKDTQKVVSRRTDSLLILQ